MRLTGFYLTIGTTHIRTSESLPFQESNNPEVDVSNHPQNNDSVKKISVTNQFTGAAVATCLGPDLTVIKVFTTQFLLGLLKTRTFCCVNFQGFLLLVLCRPGIIISISECIF